MWPFADKNFQRGASVFALIIGVYLLTFRPGMLNAYFDVFTLGAIVTFLAILYFFDTQ